MATTIDRVSVTLVERMEFVGHQTVTFDLPPEHWLVAALREWHERSLTDDVCADVPTDIALARREP